MSFWERFKTFEPALLGAVLAAIVGTLALWGIDASAIGDRLGNSWALLYPAIILLQGWWVRGKVYSPGTVAEEYEPKHRAEV